MYGEGGEPNGFVMLALDDTENKKAAREIRRQNELFAIGEELSNIGSWAWDGDRREVVFSSNALRLLGHNTDVTNRRSQTVFEWIHPDDRERVSSSVAQMLQSKKRISLNSR